MADKNTPPPDPPPDKESEDDASKSAEPQPAEEAPEQQQQPKGAKKGKKNTSKVSGPKQKRSSVAGEPPVETLSTTDVSDSQESTKKGGRPKAEKKDIPIDFYYNADELRSKPFKTDDSLPDDMLSYYHSFGYPCQKRNNLHSLSNNRLLFSTGCYLQILHTQPGSTSKYEFYCMRTIGGGSIGAITVHPRGKYFAVGEKGTSPDINIYDSEDLRLYRILRNGTTKGYNALSFNEDGDLLASQGGEPDHMLTVWSWLQESILLRCKAFSQEVYHVSFNRDLQGAVCTSGSGHIKFWNMARTFTGLKLKGQIGRFGRSPISDIEGFLEFPDGKVLSGSDWGNLLLWDEQLIKVQIGRKGGKTCHEGQVMHMRMVEGEIITAGKDGFVRSWNFELIDVLEASEESGLVELEPMNEVLISAFAHLYYLTQPARAPSKPHDPQKTESSAGVAQSASYVEEADEGRHIWFCQDGAGGIWQADLSFHLNAAAPQRLLTFHAGAIVGCVVSPLTYLVMTLGEDGTLRLFDFLRKKLLAVREFQAKGSCLVWIPIYLDHRCATVLAGFSDGAIRRVAIDGSNTSIFGMDRLDCQLKLLQVIKPHSTTVTDLAYSREGSSTQSGRVSSLATISEDQTIFFFSIYTNNAYQPLCFIPLLYVPRHVIWSPDSNSRDHVLVTCDGGIVIEMIQPKILTTTDTLECRSVHARVMKFVSIKSELLHQQELDKEAALEAERQKEREKKNKALLEKELETPSQQNLRIEAENAEAAAKKKAAEETEEPWAPYIPAVPSPILQILYLEGGGKFWLLMGDYDAGFFYEYQFRTNFRTMTKSDPLEPKELRPLRAIPLEGGLDDVITSHCFMSDGACVFLGMQDGRVRVQFLEVEFDLANQRMYWSVALHDSTHGAIQSLRVSHDEVFLITAGLDGNFFVFTLLGEDLLQEVVKVEQAQIPAGVVEEAQVDDIPPEYYTIEEYKQRSDQELLLKMAEKRKQEKRIDIASLRAQFTHLTALNNDLPPHHRLTPDEFVMDPTLVAEAQQQKQRKLEILHKQLAWQTEKADLGLKKLTDFYRQHVHTDHFCVRAINSNHVVRSYRMEKRHYRPSAMFCFKGSSLQTPYMDSEESTKDDEEEEAEIARMLGNMPGFSEDIMGASERTIYLLKKMQAKRVKRARRKLAWRRFMETKPGDDVEDPKDVADIQRAKDTLGDRPLKSDSSYVVPDTYRLTMVDGGRRLDGCQTFLQRMQIDFNRQLMDLREEKLQTITEIRQCILQLQKVHDHLDMAHYQMIPQCPAMALDEQPGGNFHLDASTENRLRREAKDKLHTRIEQQLQQDVKESTAGKARRRSSLAIAKENLIRRLRSQDVGPTDILSLHRASRGGSTATGTGEETPTVRQETLLEEHQELSFQSPLWKELRSANQLQLQYEQKMLLTEIKRKTALFNIHHRQLRHEKFELDVMVKMGELRVTTLQEEQLLLMECEHVESEIQSRIDSYQEQKNDMERSLRHIQSQINRLTRETEENIKKDKALYIDLENIIGDSNPFHDYLVKVYRKKIKRKPARTKEENTELSDSSESESESSEDDEESDDDDENAVHYDVNICPAKCSEEIYGQVVALREQRLDLDEEMAEIKKTKETFVKDMDAAGKKRQGMDQTLTKAQKELSVFQLAKQKRVNDLYAVCTIQLHQIQCLRHNGEFRGITNELILDEQELLRLHRRIEELKEEKKEEKRKTVERQKLHLRLKYEKSLFEEKLAEMEEICNKEMVAKFGQIVDLEVVETVMADPQLEEVRSRLIRDQRQCDKERQVTNKHVADVKRSSIDSLRLDTEYKLQEVSLRTRIRGLQKQLDARLASNKGTMDFQDQGQASVSKDFQDLEDAVVEQQKTIKQLLMEIHNLQKGSRALPL